MASEKNPSADPLAALATDTARTRSAIERLQAKLSAELAEKGISTAAMSPKRVHKQSSAVSAPVSKSLVEIPDGETEEELERQLQKYFAATSVQPRNLADVSAQARDELRDKVVESVVRRIISEWARADQDRPAGARLGNEIMERLIQRVLEEFEELAIAS